MSKSIKHINKLDENKLYKIILKKRKLSEPLITYMFSIKKERSISFFSVSNIPNLNGGHRREAEYASKKFNKNFSYAWFLFEKKPGEESIDFYDFYSLRVIARQLEFDF